MRVKIGTWNVEYGRGERNARRLAKLREHDADVWVLTETHDDIDLSETHEPITTERRPSRERPMYWTTIWSRLPCLERIETVDPSRTVAARLELAPGHDLILYGTVLPWNGDSGPDKDHPAKGWTEFDRVVPQQGEEWARLRRENPDTLLVVAGDLNQSFGNTHYYGTKAGRALLREQLAGANLQCLTEHECFRQGDLTYAPIDHVCAAPPTGWDIHSNAKGWDNDAGGDRLSDHSGAVVEISLQPTSA